MRVLVTGHTGFKGAWLSLWLREQGHQVGGYALEPEEGSLFGRIDATSVLDLDCRGDIRESERVRACIEGFAPEAIIHMAAQSLVRRSYVDPRWTVETNVLGTLSVLEAASVVDSVQACVVVTTDKVYRNVGKVEGYIEDDPLGGRDPYSASKAMADILTSSWAASTAGTSVASARAGNVIGGGDVSSDRLLPDVVRAVDAKTPVTLRFPEAVRPWQHVLDCLAGYTTLVEALLQGEGSGAWNFGPSSAALRSVRETVELAFNAWGIDPDWICGSGDNPHEEALLTLDASRARAELGWCDRLDYESAVRWTVEWERRVRAGESALGVTREQIQRYEAIGTSA